MHLILQQIQFPALDIRLSYNDIQLFLSITKSIPTANTPLPSESDSTAAPSTEPTATPKDSFRQKTEALIGVEKVNLKPVLYHHCHSFQKNLNFESVHLEFCKIDVTRLTLHKMCKKLDS